MLRPASALLMMVMPLAGCPSSSEPAADAPPPCWPDPEPGAPEGEVELGLGGDAFVPVAEDDPVELISGPQGGHHFILRSRTRGMLPGEDRSTKTLFTALTEDGEEIDIFECPYDVPYEPAADDFLLLREEIFLIIEEEHVPSIDGTPLLFRVEVIDADGRYARDERMLTATNAIEEAAEARRRQDRHPPLRSRGANEEAE